MKELVYNLNVLRNAIVPVGPWVSHQKKAKQTYGRALRLVEIEILEAMAIDLHFEFGKTTEVPRIVIDIMTGVSPWDTGQARLCIEARTNIRVIDMPRRFDNDKVRFLQSVCRYLKSARDFTTGFVWDTKADAEMT